MDFGGLIVSLKYLQLCFKDEWKFGTQRVEVNDDWFFFFLCVNYPFKTSFIYPHIVPNLTIFFSEPQKKIFLRWFILLFSVKAYNDLVLWSIRKKKRSSMKIIPYDSCAI